MKNISKSSKKLTTTNSRQRNQPVERVKHFFFSFKKYTYKRPDFYQNPRCHIKFPGPYFGFPHPRAYNYATTPPDYQYCTYFMMIFFNIFHVFNIRDAYFNIKI